MATDSRELDDDVVESTGSSPDEPPAPPGSPAPDTKTLGIIELPEYSFKELGEGWLWFGRQRVALCQRQKSGAAAQPGGKYF